MEGGDLVNVVLISAAIAIFALSETESFLTPFAFFLAYGIVSLSAAAILGRIGSANVIIVGLIMMIIGCLIIPLPTSSRVYHLVLVELFVIASGITLLQAAANPLSAVLSPAFNSLGTMIGSFLAAQTGAHLTCDAAPAVAR